MYEQLIPQEVNLSRRRGFEGLETKSKKKLNTEIRVFSPFAVLIKGGPDLRQLVKNYQLFYYPYDDLFFQFKVYHRYVNYNKKMNKSLFLKFLRTKNQMVKALYADLTSNVISLFYKEVFSDKKNLFNYTAKVLRKLILKT